jgi:hypothetical protein
VDDSGLDVRLALDGHDAEAIASVFVRDAGWLDPAGWDPVDHAYMHAETQAALLAWLAGLPCPVVNRPSAALWYRPHMPMLAWRPLLRQADLPTAETLFTNEPLQAREFGRKLEAAGVGGAVCTPLTGNAAWLVTESDWPGIAALQELAPVCLTEPHGATHFACVVGGGIVWDGAPPREIAALAPRLVRFAQMARLDLVEIAIAPVRRGSAVVLVEPRIRPEHFPAPVCEQILDAVVDLLSRESTKVRDVEDTLQ